MRSRVLADLLGGFAQVFVLNLGFTLLLLRVESSGGSGIAFLSFLYLGLSQLLYVLPIMWLYWRWSRPEWVKGMAAGAIITMLLNGTCYLPGLGGIPIMIGICISLVSLFVLAILGIRRG